MSLAPERIGSVIESLLLISPEPVGYARLAEIIRIEEPEVSETEVFEAIERLVAQYRDDARAVARGIRVEDLGDALQFRTVGENAPFVRRLLAAKPQKLSKASLETLSVVAYRQPVTKPEIESIRGVDSGAALKSLLEHDLVKILGKREEIGRPIIYGTTRHFLEFFGLRSLAELPTLREYHELDEEHQRQVEGIVHDKRKLSDLAGAVHFLSEREQDPDLEALEEAVGVADRVRRAAEQILNPGAPNEAEASEASEGSESPDDLASEASDALGDSSLVDHAFALGDAPGSEDSSALGDAVASGHVVALDVEDSPAPNDEPFASDGEARPLESSAE
ncbi:MAG: SMC-Scp complex subunit ScpB [Deltaproteobacteria bacterium]|nr:SMC-Scp complex subunit ScpB [Deltaproteobacteria bacterium]